jgi:hypothetical protein
MRKGQSWFDRVTQSDAGGVGAVLAALLTILGAWGLTAFVQRALDDRDFDRNEVREKIDLLYSVTSAAGEAAGSVYSRGQSVIQMGLWRQAGLPESQKGEFRQQEIEVRKAFNKALESWRASAVGWGSSLRFIDAAPDGLLVGNSGGAWQQVEEIVEDYTRCIQTPVPNLDLAGALPCSQYEDDIKGRLDDWITVLLEESASLRSWVQKAR